MKNFGGKILFLDRDDINTDEIIPAKYLTTSTKESLKPHLLEDLKLDKFDSKKDIDNKGVVISKANFGCGSSREHAVWAFEENNINVVIALNFARIFRKNMYNCGLLAIELPKATIDELFKLYSNSDAEAKIDLANKKINIVVNNNTVKQIDFQLSSFDEELIKTGGWLDFAEKRY